MRRRANWRPISNTCTASYGGDPPAGTSRPRYDCLGATLPRIGMASGLNSRERRRLGRLTQTGLDRRETPPRPTATPDGVQLNRLVERGLETRSHRRIHGSPVRPTCRIQLQDEPTLEFEAPAARIPPVGIDGEGDAQLSHQCDEDHRNRQQLRPDLANIDGLGRRSRLGPGLGPLGCPRSMSPDRLDLRRHGSHCAHSRMATDTSPGHHLRRTSVSAPHRTGQKIFPVELEGRAGG